MEGERLVGTPSWLYATLAAMAKRFPTTNKLILASLLVAICLVVPPCMAQTPDVNNAGGNPVGALLMLWAIWGAIVDWRYKKRGGVRPTRVHKIALFSAISICVAALLDLHLGGLHDRGVGQMAGLLFAQVLFPLWQFSRWRIRRKNPIAMTKARAG